MTELEKRLEERKTELDTRLKERFEWKVIEGDIYFKLEDGSALTLMTFPHFSAIVAQFADSYDDLPAATEDGDLYGIELSTDEMLSAIMKDAA